MTWEVFFEMAKTFGLPIAILMGVSAVLYLMWRTERAENRDLNHQVQQNLVDMTEAVVTGRDVQKATQEAIQSVDSRLKDIQDGVKSLRSAKRKRGGES